MKAWVRRVVKEPKASGMDLNMAGLLCMNQTTLFSVRSGTTHSGSRGDARKQLACSALCGYQCRPVSSVALLHREPNSKKVDSSHDEDHSPEPSAGYASLALPSTDATAA